MSSFTPGPWTSDTEFGTAIVGANGDTVASVLNQINARKNQWPVPHSLDTVRANACLIAAAPDMLEALEKLVDALDGRVHSNPALSALANAKVALSKANGDQP